ncbi:hypothetical protein O3P69_013526 [Scylla paramamosain]|uniref:Helicase C-terminal domain-containing protein n=1 Tax=Scylla paramamosain TaxID=85552 RepID=A0AAW0S9C7_SCYPA
MLPTSSQNPMLMPQMGMAAGGSQAFQDPMLQYGAMAGGMPGSYGSMAPYPWYSQPYTDPRAYHGPAGYPYAPQYGSQGHNWGGITAASPVNEMPLQHSLDHLAMGNVHSLPPTNQGLGAQGQGMGQQGQGMSTQGQGMPEAPEMNGRGINGQNMTTSVPLSAPGTQAGQGGPQVFAGGTSEASPGHPKTPPVQEEEKKEKEEDMKKEDAVKDEEEEEDKKESVEANVSVKKEDSSGKKEELTFDWTEGLFKDYYPGLLSSSVKFQIFFQILEGCVRLGDRLLVFSQSLFTLTLLEEFLQRSYIPGSYEGWARNRSYFRLDGSTSAIDREKLINEFNSNPTVRLFLVSTRAGSLGINLVGANRVIVFDASFNPCHDTQAVCRVYRYGQKKECYIYRLVTDNSLEKRIYDRQVNKQGISDRIVDELNPDAHLSSKEISNLLVENESDPEPKDLSEKAESYKDPILQEIIRSLGKNLTREPFKHESLLVDRKDKRLSQAEKRLAKRSYELEKQANISYSRPSYAAFYPKTQGGQVVMGTKIGGVVYAKPVGTVRPIQAEMGQRLEAGNASGPTIIHRPNILGRGGGQPSFPVEALAKQGVSVQQITVPKDVSIPTNSGDGKPILLKAGQSVMVIKTQKGIYLRLNDGKIVAIRVPPGNEEVFGLPLNKGSVTIVPTLVNSPRPRLGVGRGGGGLAGGARRGRPPMAVQYATGGLITKGSLGTAGRLAGKKPQAPQAVLNKSVVITPAQRTGGSLGRALVTKGLRDIQVRPKVHLATPKAGPAPILGKNVKKGEVKKVEEGKEVGGNEGVSTTPQTTTTATTTTEGDADDVRLTTPKMDSPEQVSEEKSSETSETVSQTQTQPPTATPAQHSEVVLGQPSRTAVGFTRDAPQLTGDARTGIVKPQIQARTESQKITGNNQNQSPTFSTAQTNRPTASLTPLQSMSNLLPPPASTASTTNPGFPTQPSGFPQTSQPLFQPFLQPQNPSVSTAGSNLGSNVAQVAPQVHPPASSAPSPPYIANSSPVTTPTSTLSQFSYSGGAAEQAGVTRGPESPLNLSQLLGTTSNLDAPSASNTAASNTGADDLTHHSALEYLNYTLSQSSSAFRRPDYPTSLSADLQSLLNSAQQPVAAGNPGAASFPGYQPPYQYSPSYRPTGTPYSYPAQYPHYSPQYPLSPAPPTQPMGQYGGLHHSPTPPL